MTSPRGTVWVVTTVLPTGPPDLEVFDAPPTFVPTAWQSVHMANVNGGDSVDVTDALRAGLLPESDPVADVVALLLEWSAFQVPSITCAEAETFARLLADRRGPDAAAWFLHGHSHDDDDPEDLHHRMPEPGAPR